MRLLFVFVPGGIGHNPYFNRWFSAINTLINWTEDDIVTILILIDGFLQYHTLSSKKWKLMVTILILIDGFLQYNKNITTFNGIFGHNPYFNRWFSAI